MLKGFSNKKTTQKEDNMKYTKIIGVLAIGLATILPTQAQLGGFGKKLLGNAGDQQGGADLGKMENDLFSKMTPAADLLEAASKLYDEALGLKKKDNKKAAKKDSKGVIVLAGMKAATETGKGLGNAAKNPDSVTMSPEQKEKFKQAHAKLREGFAAFVAVTVPVALAIKEVTEKDPKALLFHPELAMLGLACVKDVATFAKMGVDSAKFAKAKLIDVPSGEAGFIPAK